MLGALASTAIRHPRRMLLLALVAFLVAAVLGAPAVGMLNAREPFSDPASQSARAQQLVEQATGREPSPGVLALVSAPPGTPAVASAAREIARVPGVAAVTAPTPGRETGLVSTDGRSSLVVATLSAAPDPDTVVKHIEATLHGRSDVLLGGPDVAGTQTGKQAQADLGFAEAIAFPLLAILAFVIFRGIAALLPLAVGGMAVLGTFVVLRLVNLALPLSIFALNLVIGLGLGLAVDYSLFLVWRFREELQERGDVETALRSTLARTGRTVAFSATTVAAALASLTVFPQRFLVSMGIGGAMVALVAAASALLIVPPLLVLLARRLGRVKPSTQGGAWYRLARGVMRRPVLVATATTALLLLMAAPALSVRWSGIDATVLPTSQSARVVSDRVASEFTVGSGGNAITVVARAPASDRPALAGYAEGLARAPGVTASGPPVQLAPGTWQIMLVSPNDPISPAAQQTVRAIRAQPAPVPVLVGGTTASFVDQGTSIAGALPPAIAILCAVTLLVLWLMTGSVILPIKSLLMNGLTAAAATGILVFVFQDGRLAGPLAYTSQGGIEETDFLIVAAIAFALSTDYGVFLLARISEERRPGVSERDAIAAGMQRTGRLITWAAILLAVAVGVFATSKLVFLKEVGIGVAVAVLIDAFIVRALLVPSLMALLGRWNWWAPAWLERLHRRVAIRESGTPAPATRPAADHDARP
ncbi:MMPL family transporter [Streptacidiphilus neutrinimicus]|uniref:MMPL family transporter n=1 Tax=Streptacidiphilus neutrinimicus TaxID=105420 RepID=UPI000694E0F2|nr:MMPL family transporter [Streptacidiphilus neutrinimicus]